MKNLLTLALVLAAACGSKSSAPTTPTAKTESGEHMKMPAEVVKFHDVIAPRWHAEKGEQRMKDTCAAMADFHSGADAIAKASAPAGSDANAWMTGGKNLTDAVAQLDTTCKSNDASAFETAFEQVHKSFHAVMEAGGGHHEEKCEGHDEHCEHMDMDHDQMGHDEQGEHKM